VIGLHADRPAYRGAVCWGACRPTLRRLPIAELALRDPKTFNSGDL
jgi:hypothetical protein